MALSPSSHTIHCTASSQQSRELTSWNPIPSKGHLSIQRFPFFSLILFFLFWSFWNIYPLPSLFPLLCLFIIFFCGGGGTYLSLSWLSPSSKSHILDCQWQHRVEKALTRCLGHWGSGHSRAELGYVALLGLNRLSQTEPGWISWHAWGGCNLNWLVMTWDVQGREKQIKYKWTGLMSLLNRTFSAFIIWYD